MLHPAHARATLLAQLPLFRSLDQAQLATMAAAAREVPVARGDWVFRRGDPVDGLYVVASGRIKLSLASPRGQERVVEIFGPGQSFGEAVMFLDKPYPVDGQAVEDSLLIWISRQEIDAAIARDGSFARRMLAGLSLRLHGLLQDIEAVSLQSARQRVAAYLLAQAGTGQAVHLDLSKHLVASRLGLTPETFSRLLGQLAERELIEVSGPDIRLLDREGLEAQLYGG